MPPVGRGHKVVIEEATLRRLFLDEGKSPAVIGRIVGCSGATVYERLREAGFPMRRPSDYPRKQKRFEIDLAVLHELYVVQRKPAREIAEIVGCSTETASVRIREAGLTRPRSELRGWKQPPESNRKRSESHKKLWDQRGRKTSEHQLHLQRAEWKARAKECYARDGWLCRDCGVHCDGRPGPNKIQCHHVISRGNGGSDDLSNLVTLCNACHKTREWRFADCLFA
jgi:5-methylcytosine-specific restriction endonuclease McrA